MAYGYIQAFLQFPNAKNGTLKVFLANSTTEAILYDPVNGNPVSQPISIDSEGFSAQFWAETELLFDLHAYDYIGNPVETRNNVSVLGGSSGAVGPQGPQGVQGPAGATGATGATGAAGTNGTNGTDGEDGTDGISLVSIRVDETTDTGKVLYNLSSDPNNWIDAGDIVPAGLGQAKVTGTDSLGFLEEKVVAGTDVSIDNSGTQLTINNTAPETFKTQASQYSTVRDFLNTIIEGTSGITVTTSADFNKIILSGAGIGGSGFTPKGSWVSGTTYNEGEGVWYYDDSVSPVINRYYVATTPTATNPYTEGTGWVIMFSIDQLGDQMVKLDSADSQTGFWLDKVKAGQGITFTRTVNAGGDYITIDGQPTFSVGVNGTDKTISDLSNIVDFVDGELTEVVWDGNTIKVNHDTSTESGTVITQTATGLPKFDNYGHYKGESDAIEISDVTGLSTALTTAGDGQVAIQAGDTKGYLEDKIIVAGAIDKATVGSPSDKYLQLIGTGEVAVSNTDAVGFLEDKIIAGDNVSITIEYEGTTDEKVKVSVDLPALDDDYPIIAEYGNPSGVSIATNNSGSAVMRIAGKSTEFPLNTARIDNYSKFNTSTGVFAPEKDGYYVMSFKGWLQPTSSTSLNVDVSLGVRVETSYDGVTWSSMGSDASKWFYLNTDNNSHYGKGTPIAFDMPVDMKDNTYSGAHKQARIVIQQNSFGSGYNNSLYVVYPQIYFYEIKRPIGLQGPKGDTGEQGPAGTVLALDAIPDVNVAGAAVGQVLGFNGATWVPVTGGGGSDTYTVKSTAEDIAPSYLYNKLTAGAGMTISTDGDVVTLSVNPPQDSLQTFQIAMADSTGGSFDGSFGHITAVYVPYNTTIDRMACYVTQTGSGNLYLCVYDSSFNLVGVSNAFTPSTYGVAVATMTTTFSLSKNTRYFFGVIGDANGCQLLKYGAAFISNEPFLAKADFNLTSPPSTFSGGSSSSDRFWIIGYKS